MVRGGGQTWLRHGLGKRLTPAPSHCPDLLLLDMISSGLSWRLPARGNVFNSGQIPVPFTLQSRLVLWNDMSSALRVEGESLRSVHRDGSFTLRIGGTRGSGCERDSAFTSLQQWCVGLLPSRAPATSRDFLCVVFTCTH